MSDAAHNAWANERKTHARLAYMAGFDRGQDEAARKIADLIEDNLELISTFAKSKSPELIVHMLRHLVPERDLVTARGNAGVPNG